MSRDSEAKDWKSKSGARRGKKPTFNFTDLDEQTRAVAEICALAKVFTQSIIPFDADEMDELPRELRQSLINRSSQRPTQNEKT